MMLGEISITPAMVLTKWAAQLGMAQIPRSTNQQRLAENLLAGSAVMPPLPESAMRILSNLQLLTTTPLCVAV
jgi:diketogulonate reductase-like aldo/keto reductase